LPSLGRDLHASGTDLQWVVDTYILVVAALLVAGGVIGDRRGRRLTFLTGLALFAAGSLGCALAPSVPWLLAARVVQALGPVLVLPASLAIVSTIFPDPVARAKAIGFWGAGSGLGVAAGPTVGGVVVDAFGWRGVFAMNVPLAVLLLVLALRSIPHLRPAEAPVRFDFGGALTLTAGVAAVAYAIIEGRIAGWSSAPVAAASLLAVAALTAFALVERRHRAPLVDLALLARRPFLAANLGAAALSFAMFGMTVFVSAFFQQIQDRSPTQAGLSLLPFGLGIVVVAPVSGRITAAVGARRPMVGGLAVASVAMITLLSIGPDTSVASLAWRLGLLGASIGLALPSMTVTAVTSVEVARAGMAAAIHNAGRQLGQTLGVAVVGAIVLAGTGAAADGGRRLAGAEAAAWIDGLHHAIIVCAALLAVAAAGVAATVPRTARALS
jgi:DHA2 family methylenomycin A resistance protein-like MFS transporter